MWPLLKWGCWGRGGGCERRYWAMSPETPRGCVAAQAHTVMAPAQSAVFADGPAQVVFLEWTVPLFPGGHWTPQMIEMAGGLCPINPPK